MDALCVVVDSPPAALILQHTSPCLSSIKSLLAVLRLTEYIVKKVGAVGCLSSNEGCSFHGIIVLQMKTDRKIIQTVSPDIYIQTST